MSIIERVRMIVADVLHVPVAVVAPDTPLAELAALDSLKLVEVLAALDDEFCIQVPGDGLTALTSAAELARRIEKLTSS